MRFFERCEAYFTDLQDRIIASLEALDGGRFLHDDWQRPPLPAASSVADHDGPVLGGGGRTRVLEGGRIFEKAGVNFSSVRGYFSREFAATMPGDGRYFEASGVSLVLHPRNPHVPTVHMNVRRLSRGDTGWFGGGADLTPYYLDEGSARDFHAAYKAACAAHPKVGDYAAMKQTCDEYFFLPHRGEARGIGGIFFDHLSDAPEDTFAFVRAVGDAFVPSYVPIVERFQDAPVTEAEREWQLIRRGRYVEFNLVHDRGTTFGLKTGGRTESILMSLPNAVAWRYDHQPEAGSREAELVEVLRNPREW